jgi:hypothetical protein
MVEVVKHVGLDSGHNIVSEVVEIRIKATFSQDLISGLS